MRGIIWLWACDKRGLESETQEVPPAPCPHEYFQIQFTHLFNTQIMFKAIAIASLSRDSVNSTISNVFLLFSLNILLELHPQFARGTDTNTYTEGWTNQHKDK